MDTFIMALCAGAGAIVGFGVVGEAVFGTTVPVWYAVGWTGAVTWLMAAWWYRPRA
jgi:hypothetical protein